MGGIISYLIGDSNGPDALENIDPRIDGFTKEQKNYMKKTWDQYISKNLTAVGIEVMLSLLEYDDIKEMFPVFKNIPSDQLRLNKKFQAHCQSIMNVINNALNAFFDDDDELFEEILKITGERHAKRAKSLIIIKHFECVPAPLIESLKSRLKSQWTEGTANLWTYALEKVIEAIIRGVKEHLFVNKQYISD